MGVSAAASECGTVRVGVGESVSASVKVSM